MKGTILGLPSVALVVGLIAGTAARAQSDTIYQYNMVIDPVTYNGQVYAGGSVSFALSSEALPTQNPDAPNQLQFVSLSPAPVFDGLTLSSVGTAAYGQGNCAEPNGPCSTISMYLLQTPFIPGNISGAPGQLLDLWMPWIPGAPGPGQFTYPDGTTGAGFGLLIGNGCANPFVCGSTFNLVYTGGDIDVSTVPEISANGAGAALTLLLGGLMIVRGRRRMDSARDRALPMSPE